MFGMLLLDGEECFGGKGLLSLDDPAITGGWAVFETLRTYAGVPFGLGAHLLRLRASAVWCDIRFDEALIREEIARVLVNTAGESRINVYLSAGGRRIVRSEGLDLSRVGAPVRVVTRSWSPPSWLPGNIKHTSRLAWSLAARGVDEVLWESENCWTEANRSNVFVVRDGTLLTPLDDGRILSGVTRAALLACARSIGIAVREEPVPAGPCDELYLASTLKELAPVVVIDGRAGPGAGPIGAAVLAEFRARVLLPGDLFSAP